MSEQTITNPAIQTLVTQGLAAIDAAPTSAALQEVRVAYLGKSGSLAAHPYFQTIKTASPEEKKVIGANRTAATLALSEALDLRKAALELAELNARLAQESLDITLPAAPAPRGSIHPITQVTEELTAIFADFGFRVAEGPEIEDDFHNFTALNIPESHPARQMHDTFYLRGRANKTDAQMTDDPMIRDDSPTDHLSSSHLSSHSLLRTHTSPVQIRTMIGEKPPIRIIAPGTTYRSDSDMTHTPMFHQLEGLVIEKAVHMGHLKGLLSEAFSTFFGVPNLKMRFRASFFPFTEPSAELDIGCHRTKDSLTIGEGDDWLEIGGCGMVHPNVLRNCGLNPDEWQGFAFGCGIERLAMLKYNIPDLRTMFAGDLRWLKHYGFSAFDVPSLLKGVAA